MTYRI